MASSRRQRSLVWEYFVKIDEKSVKCKLCVLTLTVLAYHGGTTAMLSHLTSQHPHEYRSPAAATSSKNRSMDEFVACKKCPAARGKEITRRIA